MPIEKPLRSFRYLGHEVTIHADAADTNGQYSVLEFRAYPGGEPPMHIHENEDEMFILVEGEMKVTIAGVDRTLKSGESATVKRGTPHTFKVLTPSIRTVNIFTPAGFEEFFRALAGDRPPSFDQIAPIAARYGSRLLV